MWARGYSDNIATDKSGGDESFAANERAKDLVLAMTNLGGGGGCNYEEVNEEEGGVREEEEDASSTSSSSSSSFSPPTSTPPRPCGSGKASIAAAFVVGFTAALALVALAGRMGANGGIAAGGIHVIVPLAGGVGISAAASTSTFDGEAVEEGRPSSPAVSYNFLRTAKGSETMRLLLSDLFSGNDASGGGEGEGGGTIASLRRLSELMESDGQIHSSCHPLAHGLGRAAYQYHNGNIPAAYGGLIGTDDATYLRLCNAAYLHGVIERHLWDVEDIADLTREAMFLENEVCAKLGNVMMGEWECRHGIGHGIARRQRKDSERIAIAGALAGCADAYPPGPSGQRAVPAGQCENGVWMDHFAVTGNALAEDARATAADVVREAMEEAAAHAGDGGEAVAALPAPLPLPSSMRICTDLASPFSMGDCHLYAPTEYILAHPGDYVGAFEWCNDPVVGRWVNRCIDGVGMQVGKEHIDDFGSVEEICLKAKTGIQSQRCFSNAVNYYTFSSGGKRPVCDNVVQFKNKC